MELVVVLVPDLGDASLRFDTAVGLLGIDSADLALVLLLPLAAGSRLLLLCFMLGGASVEEE
ncbi:hypothetical protein RJ029_05525, partial [Brucella melitensis]|nr:hypothetical protein [Brucella melitensis]